MLAFSSQGKIAVGPHYDHNRLRAEAATALIGRKRAIGPKPVLRALARRLAAFLPHRHPKNARIPVRVSRRT